MQSLLFVSLFPVVVDETRIRRKLVQKVVIEPRESAAKLYRRVQVARGEHLESHIHKWFDGEIAIPYVGIFICSSHFTMNSAFIIADNIC